MQRGVPALQCRMCLIDTGLLRQLFAKGAAFAHAVAVEQLAPRIARLSTLAQFIEAPPLAGECADARDDDQAARRAAGERKFAALRFIRQRLGKVD